MIGIPFLGSVAENSRIPATTACQHGFKNRKDQLEQTNQPQIPLDSSLLMGDPSA